MSRRGKRSTQAKQRRAARKAGLDVCYRDKLRAEKASTQNTQQTVKNELKQQFGFVYPHILACYEAGNVLEDSRGNGTLQNL